MQGIVKTFNLNQEQGIISPEDGGDDIIVDLLQCPIVGVDKMERKNYRIPREGERVSYELITNSLGKVQAANIIFISQDDNGTDSDMD